MESLQSTIAQCDASEQLNFGLRGIDSEDAISASGNRQMEVAENQNPEDQSRAGRFGAIARAPNDQNIQRADEGEETSEAERQGPAGDKAGGGPGACRWRPPCI